MPTPYVKQTWLDDDTRYPVNAARMGVIEAGINDSHHRPSVRAFLAASMTIPHNVATFVSLTSESWDTDNMHDLVTNPGRIYIRTAGIYLVEACVAFGMSASASGWRMLAIQNGGASPAGIIQRITGTFTGMNRLSTVDLYVSSMQRYNVSDYIEMYVQQTSTFAVQLLPYSWGPAMTATQISF
jgi:hypothetical protein